MNAEFLKIRIANKPEKTEEKYLFLVDSEQLATRITLAGFVGVPVLGYETSGRCFTLKTFIDYMESLECKGTYRSEFIYVPCCPKSVNDALAQFLSGESLTIKKGWQLFRGKEYLEGPEHEEELKTVLKTFIRGQEGVFEVPRLESAAEFMKRDIPPLKHIVDGLMTEGVGLLAAMQKMGKTWMCYQLAGCVASGRPFLGREVSKGSVLYFDLEQAEQLRRERLRIMMPEPPESLYFINRAPIIGEGFETALNGYLDAIPDTQLVIIDVMDMVADDQKRNESPKKHAYRNISALKQIARERHIAIICVMHFRKMTDPDDFMSNISGSNGWAAAADYAIGITRKRGEAEAVLQTDGRTAKSVSLQIEQDEKAMTWSVIGNAAEVEERKKLREFENHPITQKLVRAVSDGGGHWEGTPGGLKGTAVFEQDSFLSESAIAIGKHLKKYAIQFQSVYQIRIIDVNEGNSKGAYFIADKLM